MNKKLLLNIVITALLLLSCSNKKTTGIVYESKSENTSSSNENNTEINDKEYILKHKGLWDGNLKSDTTIEYLPWSFEIKDDGNIYIMDSIINFDEINISKENTLEFTVIDIDTYYKTIATFNDNNSTANVVVEINFTVEENSSSAYYRGAMTKK